MSAQQAYLIATSLGKMLNEESMEVLTEYGHPGLFTEVQRQLLAILADFVTGDSPEGDGLDVEGLTSASDSAGPSNTSRTSHKRKRHSLAKSTSREQPEDDDGSDDERRPKKSKKSTTQMRLLKFTDLNPEIKSFRRKHQHDIPAFFTDSTHEAEPRGERIRTCVENRIVHEYLSYLVEYTDEIQARQAMDAARKVFTWVSCYDTVMYLNQQLPNKGRGGRGGQSNSKGKGRASDDDSTTTTPGGWTGRRVGKNLTREIKALLYDGVEGVDEATQEHVLTQFFTSCKRGLKVLSLTKEFGLGSIFYFAECLSNDFIENKFHDSGDGFKNLVATLHAQKFKDEVEMSGMNEWAEGIRAYCAQALGSPA